MLDLVEIALKREKQSEPRLGYCRLDGSLSADERQRALRKFRDERGVRTACSRMRASHGNSHLGLAPYGRCA